VLLRREGRVAGGLAGETYAGWLFIRYLWLEEALRRGGLGRAVIAAAEARARERGCHSAWVDTFSFQAPGFYAKQGYVEFGRLPYPPRGERLFLRKPLG
jgi:GNAT superfamily N-acetyltransferase